MTQETSTGYGTDLASKTYDKEKLKRPEVLEKNGGETLAIENPRASQGLTLEKRSLEEALLDFARTSNRINRLDIVDKLKGYSLEEIHGYLSRNGKKQIAYGRWLSDEQIDTIFEILALKLQKDYSGRIDYPYTRCPKYADKCDSLVDTGDPKVKRKGCRNPLYNSACNEPVLYLVEIE